jgi:serine/threonine-protein kinase RsbW
MPESGRRCGESVVSDSHSVSVTRRFDGHDLGYLRALVERVGHRAGLGAQRTADLVFVVNELANNAVAHGGGRGRLTIGETDDGVAVEVTDRGPGLPDDLADEQPAASAMGGRGLWMARRMCTRIRFLSSSHGLTVRVLMARTERRPER